MKTLLTNSLAMPPVASEYERINLATPFVAPGPYRVRIKGVVQPTSSSADQLFLRTTFGLLAGPVLSSASIIQLVFGGDGESYGGGLIPQTSTTAIEQGFDTGGGASGASHSFIQTGNITVQTGGYLALEYAHFSESPGAWTLVECEIELLPL